MILIKKPRVAMIVGRGTYE